MNLRIQCSTFLHDDERSWCDNARQQTRPVERNKHSDVQSWLSSHLNAGRKSVPVNKVSHGGGPDAGQQRQRTVIAQHLATAFWHRTLTLEAAAAAAAATWHVRYLGEQSHAGATQAHSLSNPYKPQFHWHRRHKLHRLSPHAANSPNNMNMLELGFRYQINRNTSANIVFAVHLKQQHGRIPLINKTTEIKFDRSVEDCKGQYVWRTRTGWAKTATAVCQIWYFVNCSLSQ